MKKTEPAWIKVRRVWLTNKEIIYPEEVQIFLDCIRIRFSFTSGEISIFPAIQVLKIDIDDTENSEML